MSREKVRVPIERLSRAHVRHEVFLGELKKVSAGLAEMKWEVEFCQGTEYIGFVAGFEGVLKIQFVSYTSNHYTWNLYSPRYKNGITDSGFLSDCVRTMVKALHEELIHHLDTLGRVLLSLRGEAPSKRASLGTDFRLLGPSVQQRCRLDLSHEDLSLLVRVSDIVLEDNAPWEEMGHHKITRIADIRLALLEMLKEK